MCECEQTFEKLIESVNEYGGNDEILAKILALVLASASRILVSFNVNVKINSNAVNTATWRLNANLSNNMTKELH